MILFKRHLFFLMLFFSTTCLLAQSKSRIPLNLKSCLNYALQNSFQLNKAELEVDKTRHKAREFLSLGLPQAKFNFDVNYNFILPTQQLPGEFFGMPDVRVPIQFGTDLSIGGNVQFSQGLYNRVYNIGKKGTQKLVEASELVFQKEKEELAFELVQLYYQALITKRQKGLLIANLNQVSRLWQLTDNQYKNDLARKIDVDRIYVSKVNLETKIKNLDLQYEQLLVVLKHRMSMPLERNIVLTDTLSENEYVFSSNVALKPNFSNKTEMQLLEVQNSLNSINVEQIEAGAFPFFALIAGYGLQGQGDNFGEVVNGDNWFSSGVIGLKIDVPIYDGGKRKAQVEQARIQQLQWKEDKAITALSLELQHKNALQKLQLHYNNLQAIKGNKSIAEEVYRVSQKRFTEGIAPITEVLSAETAMREVQGNFLTTLLQLKLAELEIMQAKGSLLDLLK